MKASLEDNLVKHSGRKDTVLIRAMVGNGAERWDVGDFLHNAKVEMSLA